MAELSPQDIEVVRGKLVSGAAVTGLSGITPKVLEQLPADPRILGLARDLLSSGFFGGAQYEKLGAADTSWLKRAPGLELIERQVLAGDQQNVVFGGLRGDFDRVYFATFQYVDKTTTGSLYIEPNGVTTNQIGVALYWSTGTAGVTRAVCSRLQAWIAFVAEDVIGGFCFILAQTGQRRTLLSLAGQTATAFGTSVGYLSTCQWNETATEITSLEFEKSGVGKIAAGGVFSLYAIRSF